MDSVPFGVRLPNRRKGGGWLHRRPSAGLRSQRIGSPHVLRSGPYYSFIASSQRLPPGITSRDASTSSSSLGCHPRALAFVGPPSLPRPPSPPADRITFPDEEAILVVPQAPRARLFRLLLMLDPPRAPPRASSSTHRTETVESRPQTALLSLMMLMQSSGARAKRGRQPCARAARSVSSISICTHIWTLRPHVLRAFFAGGCRISGGSTFYICRVVRSAR